MAHTLCVSVLTLPFPCSLVQRHTAPFSAHLLGLQTQAATNMTNTTLSHAATTNTTFVTITQLAALADDVDAAWLLGCSFLIFGMQLGFSFLEAGIVVANLRSVVMKNVFDLCLCFGTWYAIGYGIAYGCTTNLFFCIDWPFHMPDDVVGWFFDASFAATSATILSGAMAERTKSVFSHTAFACVWLGCGCVCFNGMFDWWDLHEAMLNP